LIVEEFIGSLNTAETLMPVLIVIDQLPGEVEITVGLVTSS
jgi:hypothetical protein